MAVILAEIFEPIHPGWTADSTAVTADSTIYTADGGPLAPASDFIDAAVIVIGEVLVVEAASAADALDAAVIARPAVGGGYYPPLRPFPVVGVGFGILPRLEGEGFGTVGPAKSEGDDGDDDDDELLALMLIAMAA